MTLHLNPQLENRVRDAAARRGIAPEEYVRSIVEEQLTESDSAGRREASLALLSQWDAEDETNDPAEIERRRVEWEAFRKSMNENSLSDRPVYP